MHRDELLAWPESNGTLRGTHFAFDGGRGDALASIAIAVAVLGFLADMLDRDHMLVLGGVEYDDALGGAAGDPDALDRAADQLALVGHQHDLVAVLDRE